MLLSFTSSFFFNDTAPPEIYTLSLHDALPISDEPRRAPSRVPTCRRRTKMLRSASRPGPARSEEHTSELQSRRDLVCRLLLEKKNNIKTSEIKTVIAVIIKESLPHADQGVERP